MAGALWLVGWLIWVAAVMPNEACARDYYLAPPDHASTGTPTNNSQANPIPWNDAALQTIMVSDPGSNGIANEINLFLVTTNGDFEIPPFTITNTTPANRIIRLKPAVAGEIATLRCARPSASSGGALSEIFNGGVWETNLLDFRLAHEIAGFEISDVVLDANWTNWTCWVQTNASATVASPAYVDGFKLGALAVSGRTGLVDHVEIRNCGANGIVPLPYWVGSGTECFPLLVEATRFEPGGPPSWYVQDCEVSGFHAVHGAYGTAIMVNVLNGADASSFPNYRAAIVRRCQVRGSGTEIGLGSAHSAGVAFYDNAVVGTQLGLNHDTGPQQRNMDPTNNVFLDVSALANVGATYVGIGTFTNYNISWNTVRLSKLPLLQTYRDYVWRTNVIGTFTNLMPVTDVTLAVGRFATGWTAGLRVAGVDGFRFDGNRFTTRPQSNYFEPDPTNATLAVFRPLSRPAYDWDGGSYQTNNQGGTVTSQYTNLLSTRTMDFVGMTNAAVPTNAVAARSANPDDFVPGGSVGRVQMEFDDLGRLLGVWEVSISDPVFANGQVSLKARLVYHPTPLNPNPETQVMNPGVPHSKLYMLALGDGAPVDVSTESMQGSIKTFSYTPSVTHAWHQLIVYYYTGGVSEAQIDNTFAWSRAEIRLGTTLRFERTPDVADDRRLTNGTVRISRSGPVNNALNFRVKPSTAGYTVRPAIGIPAAGADYELRTSSGALITPVTDQPADGWPVTIPASATEVTLRVQPKAGTEDVREYEAAYLDICGSDDGTYAIAPRAPGTTGYRGLPSDSNAGQGVAITFWDGPKYRLYGLGDSYPCPDGGSSSMASGGPGTGEEESGSEANAPSGELDSPAGEETPVAEGEALAYRFTRVPLDPLELDPEPPDQPEQGQEASMSASSALDFSGFYFYTSSGYAVSTETLPHVAGGLCYDNPSCYAFETPYCVGLGGWLCTDWSNCPEIGRPLKCAYTAIFYGVDDLGEFVGTYQSKPCFVAAGSTNVTMLPALTAGQYGEALAVQPGLGTPVGWSYRRVNNVNYARPTRWVVAGTNWTSQDVGAFDSSQTTPGYAYGINDSGITVGKSRVLVGTANAWRAFRTATTIATNSMADALSLPAKPSGQADLTNNVANAVNLNGAAAGATDAWIERGSSTNVETRAVVWWADSNTEPKLLPTMQPEAVENLKKSGRSEAFGISEWRTDGTASTIVGTAWATPTGQARAFVHEASDMDFLTSMTLNLNDPHLTFMPAGWTLSTAEAVNEMGWIVGNGAGPGHSQQGFVLIPQPLVTQ